MNLPRSLAKVAVSLALVAGVFPESARAGSSPCTTYGRASLALCALTGPSSLALPVLAWPGGNPGIPRVITWADTTGASGIAWGTTSQIAAANASWTYDGTNLVGNTPTGKGYRFTVNGAEVAQINGGATQTGLFPNQTTNLLGGTNSNGATIMYCGGTTSIIQVWRNNAQTADLTVGHASVSALQWPTAGVTRPASTEPYEDYDGANFIHNVPTGGLHALWVNGVAQFAISTGNATITPPVIAPGLTLNGSTTNGLTLNNGVTPTTTDVAIGKAAAANNIVYNVPTGQSHLFTVNGATIGNVSSTGLSFGNPTAPVATDVGIGSDGGTGGNLVLNVPTGKNLLFKVNGSNTFTVDGSGNFVSGGGATVSQNVVSSTSLLVLGATGGSYGEGNAVVANATNLGGEWMVSHLASGSGIPTSPTAGTGCGTQSAATIVAGSSDLRGQVGITCGTAGTNGNNFVTVTFAHAYSTTPTCVISCANAATCAGEVLSDHMANPSTTNMAVQCAGGTCTTGTLLWNYICAQ